MKIVSGLWAGVKWSGRLIGSGARAFVVLIGIAGVITAGANYTMTQGTGTTFASVVISTVHYAAGLICDATVGTSQCATVGSTGSLQVDVTSGGVLGTLAAAPERCKAGTAPSTQTAVGSGATTAVQCDLNGNTYISPQQAGGVPLGQALGSASVPVVLPAAQITTLTPPSNTGYALSANQTGDPCSLAALKTNLPITSNTSALTQIIAASGSTKIYVCSLALIATSAEFITFNTGTGTNCGSSTVGLIGGTTVATNGLSLAANGGLTLGNGAGTIAVTGAGGEVCVALSGTTYINGNLTYVQQ